MTLFRDLLIEKKRRRYYCEVEYLQSSGTQYIDTGVVAKSGLSSVLNFEYTALSYTASMLDARSGNNRFYLCHAGAPSSTFYFYYGYGSAYQSSVVPTSNTKYLIETNLSVGTQSMKVNGTQILTGTDTTNYNLNANLYLFGMNYSTPQYLASAKLYCCKIWDNGTLIRDFIPVLDWNMTPCMYDKVSGQLFYNAGSGNDFLYGREIHYVDYLESTGTQYIDTGVKLTNNHSVELDYQLTATGQSRTGLFGALNLTGTNQGRFGSILSPSNRYLEHGYGSGNDYWQQGSPDTQRHKIYQKKNELYFDGTLIHTFNTATFSLAMNAYLGNFVYTNYTPALAKYYSSKWWDGNTLVRDYKPAIDENGVCFWFDKVQHTIYDNAGTGLFKYPERELEYIESTGTQYIDTGYVPNINTECSMNVAFTSLDTTYRTPFSVRTANSASNSFTIMSANSQQNNNSFAFGSTYWSGSVGLQITLNKITKAILKKDYAYWDGNTGNPGNSITPTSLTAYMFARNANGTASNFFKGRIYDCQLKENGTLVRDYIPCFKDGSSGMYDKANNVFYPNAGTGSLVCGKIVEPEYE